MTGLPITHGLLFWTTRQKGSGAYRTLLTMLQMTRHAVEIFSENTAH